MMIMIITISGPTSDLDREWRYGSNSNKYGQGLNRQQAKP